MQVSHVVLEPRRVAEKTALSPLVLEMLQRSWMRVKLVFLQGLEPLFLLVRVAWKPPLQQEMVWLVSERWKVLVQGSLQF